MNKKVVGLISAAGLVFTVACGQTDAGITTSVKSKMATDDTVKAYQVDVDTVNHVVTLSGDVSTAAAREQAVRIARTTDGVTDVVDQLRVVPTAATSGIDTDIDDDIERGARRSGEAIKDGAEHSGEAIKDGAEHSGAAIKEGAEESGAAIKRDAKRGGEAIKDGAEDAGGAIKDGAKRTGGAIKDGAKKTGRAIKDAVTDNDRDSDRDGR